VAGEHVVIAVDGDHDLNTVQEPTCTHPLVGVADHKTVDLPGGRRINVCVRGKRFYVWGGHRDPEPI